MLDIYRYRFREGAQGDSAVWADVERQFAEAGLRRASTGDGYWRWEQA
jgi:hypothetical protein